MRLLTVLADDHTFGSFLVGAALCAFGSTIAISLAQHAYEAKQCARSGWLSLASLYAGAMIWATYFIVTLGVRPEMGLTLNPLSTIGSAAVAIVGTALGLGVTIRSRSLGPAFIGATLLGLSIPAMHHTSLIGHQVGGLVIWHKGQLLLSIALPILFWFLAIMALRTWRKTRIPSILCAILAILASHAALVSALEVVPLAGATAPDEVVRLATTMAVAMVALLLVATGIACYLIDERLAQRFNRRLFNPAFRDALTGLPNRYVLMAHLSEAFASDRWFKLLLVDLDHFKLVNSNHGKRVGDAVLIEVANRLRHLAGSDALVFRVGGDEMAMLVFGKRDNALQMGDDVVIALRSPYAIKGQVLTLGCNVGHCASDNARTPDELMQLADAALRDSKRRGSNQVSRYTKGLIEALADRTQRELDLKTALDERQFVLAYQPLVDIHTRSPIGNEALIRWNHPQHGPISPAEFIPLAEETGMILPIGKWVLEEACRAAAGWPIHQHVAVNVSALQFRSPMFMTHVAQALADSGLPAARLEVELTETAIVSDEKQLAHVLKDLRALGVKISMDDFGTGYSSLSHLRDLPLDRVKIDRSFVAAASSDRNSMAVLRAVTQLGRDMGIATLGEGVETEEQFHILKELGCDAVQGYLTGRPEVPKTWRANVAA
ncbi:bifunctional diguanylate cyclase/phosphodiesterase [Aureimonas sp. AU20]|uniref:putative bifunctional diguanylate cyclase/phosphodiesterase n=1 Tax=Aureimonas sp. AU20 TaxID=1349819 RepID=UPI0007217F73|nr:EAL domain-containing protein [Aureimonas sp. AU20]ALN72658.1 hypothetical protein M673_08035 [Aureimonas sp. AU20]